MAYVYTHTRLDTNDIFYVGIGSIKNYKREYNTYNRSNHWKKIYSKTNCRVDIIYDNLTWEDACEKEIQLIMLYGRIDLGNGKLCNYTNGGNGTLGSIKSKEVRDKISNSTKGRVPSQKTRKMISESLTGEKNLNSKIVLNKITGIYYCSAKEASISCNMNYHTFMSMLNGQNPNKTNFNYI